MADHDDEALAEDDSERRELQRIAFARPKTSADAEAAADALRQLIALEEVAAASADAANSPEGAAVAADPTATAATTADETADHPDGEAPRPDSEALASDTEIAAASPRRRSLVALLVIAAATVGIGCGVLIAHLAGVGNAPEPAPSGRVVTDFGFTPIGPQYASASSALAELRTRQTAADVFPLPSFTTTLDIEPKSIHRILTTGDGLTLWTGRTSEDICLLFSGSDAISRLNAGSNCATPSEFGTDGLTLSDGRDQWFWNGIYFTTTIGK